MIDFEIPEDAPRCGFSDGPLPVRTMVAGEGGQLAGEFIVWVKDGGLVGIEQAWFTDEPPTCWPTAVASVEVDNGISLTKGGVNAAPPAG